MRETRHSPRSQKSKSSNKINTSLPSQQVWAAINIFHSLLHKTMSHRLPIRLACIPTPHIIFSRRSSTLSFIISGGSSIICRSFSKTTGGSVVGRPTLANYQRNCDPPLEWNDQSTILGIRSSSSSSAHAYSNNKSKQKQTHYQQQPQQPRGKYLDMKECNSIEELCDMTYPRLRELNPRNLSSFWTKVSQLVASGSSSKYQRNEQVIIAGQKQQQKLKEKLEAIFIKTNETMMTFEPRDLTQTALGFAKIAREVAGNHNHTTTKNNYFRGVGLIGLHHELLHDIFIGNNLDDRRKEIIFQSIADAAMPNLWYFEPRFLSNLAYANAIAGSVPKEVSEVDGRTMTTTLFDRIAEVSTPLLAEFNPQDLSNIVWAYEKVGATTYPFFDEISNSILARDDLDKFPPQALSNILLAFAKVKESNNSANKSDGETNHHHHHHHYHHPKLLFEKVADHIVTAYDSLDEFTPQALANILWAYATVHECSPALFDTVANHILVHRNSNNSQFFIKSFKAQELCNIVWAYASTSNRQPILFSKVADHILSLDNLQSFNAQNCGNILWAYSTANMNHQELFERVAAHVMRNIDFKSLDESTQYNLLRASEKAQRVVRGKNALGGKKK